MKKERYVYNPKTLSYEKFVRSWRDRFINGIGILSGIIISSVFVSALYQRLFPSQKEQALLRELETMKYHTNSVQNKLDYYSRQINEIQLRDAKVYRNIFGVSPIDENRWGGGSNKYEKYQDLNSYPNIGALLKDLLFKTDDLERRIGLQIKSLDSLQILANQRENYISSMPSIKPVVMNEDNLDQLSGFGMRVHPIHKILRLHAGLDFNVPHGTPIRATGNGRVLKSGQSGSGYGLHVVIDHGYKYQTLYGHMSGTKVKAGQVVKKGQLIGYVGSTGTSTAPHLHYEVHFNGNAVDPIKYCMDGLTPSQYEQLVRKAGLSNKSFD